MKKLEADYLVIGSGAVGMAFADTILTETNASILIVDRHHMPGGHWNDAYPFVRLHQPSAFYGVASRDLGSHYKDETGSNKGYYELASGAEVSSYFDQVMHQQFLPSDRVQYLPMCNYIGDGRVVSLMSDEEYEVTVGRKTVDATYYNTTVPSTHTRKYEVAGDIACIAPNDLPREAGNYANYVIVGAGKTAMDVGVWLLQRGAAPGGIRWIVPRDSWLMNRQTTQPGMEFFEQSIGSVASQMEASAKARSVDDLFDRLEAAGALLRIDRNVRPTMYHCATISTGEVEQLRRIEDVVRLGHVRKIGNDRIELEQGTVAARADSLYIDCTASAVEKRPPVPVFDGDRITLQIFRVCQPVFSAALAAHVEAAYDGDDEKNRICTVIPLPDSDLDWMAATIANMTNQYKWSRDKDLRAWITGCRLDGFGAIVRDADKGDARKQEILARLRDNAFMAVANLQKLRDGIA